MDVVGVVAQPCNAPSAAATKIERKATVRAAFKRGPFAVSSRAAHWHVSEMLRRWVLGRLRVGSGAKSSSQAQRRCSKRGADRGRGLVQRTMGVGGILLQLFNVDVDAFAGQQPLELDDVHER